jgi:diguanylate cyclase (GGDEF)-like protein
MSTATTEPGELNLQRLLEAESEQEALDAAVAIVAHLVGGTAVGVLRVRVEYISSASVVSETQLRATLFLEALRQLNGAPLSKGAHELHADAGAVSCTTFRDGERLIAAIAVASLMVGLNIQPQLETLQIAFVRAVQRIRRMKETQLLYEISLRLSGKIDNGQLLGEVLQLINETFRSRASRVFLVDRRAGDLVMMLDSPLNRALDSSPRAVRVPALEREIMPNRPSDFSLFLQQEGSVHFLETLRVPMRGSVAGSVVESGQSFVLNDAADDRVPQLPHVAIESGMRAAKLLCVPLRQNDHILGALMLVNHADDPDFTADDQRLLLAIGSIIAVMLANVRLYERAIRDALTGAYNRGAFETRLSQQWQRWLELREGFALLILDLDDFKQVNDRFGHIAGDAVLRAVTRLLWEALRDEDTIFRYGGEEFCVILDSVIEPEQVLRIANRLRAALDCEIRIGGLVTIQISASIGAAVHPLHGAPTPQILISIADDAAYTAKRRGKNQVVLAGDMSHI